MNYDSSLPHGGWLMRSLRSSGLGVVVYLEWVIHPCFPDWQTSSLLRLGKDFIWQLLSCTVERKEWAVKCREAFLIFPYLYICVNNLYLFKKCELSLQVCLEWASKPGSQIGKEGTGMDMFKTCKVTSSWLSWKISTTLLCILKIRKWQKQIIQPDVHFAAFLIYLFPNTSWALHCDSMYWSPLQDVYFMRWIFLVASLPLVFIFFLSLKKTLLNSCAHQSLNVTSNKQSRIVSY